MRYRLSLISTGIPACVRFFPVVLLAGASQLLSQTPQRTMVSAPPSAQPTPSATPDPSATALEKYREMWRNMTSAQQKAFLDSGGQTPEQYERTLKQKAPQSSRSDRGIDPTMDALSKSLQDLNAIRDGNLGRVQKDGCPPEVASRIADLKGRLLGYESELNGAQPQAVAAVQPRESSGPADPLGLAADWYKPAAVPEPAGTRASRQSKMLGEVLAGVPTAAPPGRPAGAIEQQIAATKLEIEQLSGACIAPVR